MSEIKGVYAEADSAQLLLQLLNNALQANAALVEVQKAQIASNDRIIAYVITLCQKDDTQYDDLGDVVPPEEG